MKRNKIEISKVMVACTLSSILLFTGCQPAQESNGDPVDTDSAITTTAKVTSKDSAVTTSGATTTQSAVETEKQVKLYAYKEGDLYGYVDINAKVIIKPQYLYAEDFVGNRGIVRVPAPEGTEYYGMLSQGLFGLIDPEGEYEIPPEGVILRAGENRYLTSEPMDLWPQYGTSGWNMIKYRFTDENGNHLTEPEYYDAVEITKDLYLANNGRYTLFIDANGVYIENSPVFRFYSKIKPDGDNIILTPYDDTQDRIVITLSKDGTVLDQVTHEEKVTDTLLYTTDIISPYIGSSYFYPVFYGKDAIIAETMNQNMVGILESIMGNGSPFDTVVDASVATSQIDRTLTVDYSMVTVNNLLNIDVEGYWYGFGAAHPNSFILSYYMDITTGKQYVLSDLFLDDVDWRTELAKLIDKQFMKDPEAFFLFMDKNTPEKERLEEFYREDYYAAITEDGLQVYYQQYEIAPYAAGFPTFMMPYDELLPLINQESDFYKSITK